MPDLSSRLEGPMKRINWVVALGWGLSAAVCIAGWVLLWWALGTLAGLA